jgi:hypothetical protein
MPMGGPMPMQPMPMQPGGMPMPMASGQENIANYFTTEGAGAPGGTPMGGAPMQGMPMGGPPMQGMPGMPAGMPGMPGMPGAPGSPPGGGAVGMIAGQIAQTLFARGMQPGQAQGAASTVTGFIAKFAQERLGGGR